MNGRERIEDAGAEGQSPVESSCSSRPKPSRPPGAPRRGGLLLGYAALGEAEIREGIERLASVL